LKQTNFQAKDKKPKLRIKKLKTKQHKKVSKLTRTSQKLKVTLDFASTAVAFFDERWIFCFNVFNFFFVSHHEFFTPSMK
jgi:hypothetical protein